MDFLENPGSKKKSSRAAPLASRALARVFGRGAPGAPGVPLADGSDWT